MENAVPEETSSSCGRERSRSCARERSRKQPRGAWDPAAAQGHDDPTGDPSGAKALAAAQGHGGPPPRPAAGASTSDVETYYQTLAEWVHGVLAEAVKTQAPGLRSAAFSGKIPYQFAALPIQAQAGNEQSSSYKAPWSKAAARIAMTTAKRFEAGGNAMWVSVCPKDAKQRILAGNTASVEEIDDIEAQFFTVTLRSAS